MRRMLYGPLLSLVVLASGCATVINGTTQRIAVVTEPPGAHCALRNRSSESEAVVSATPGVAEVRRGGWPLEVRCAMDGRLDVAESHSPIHGGGGTLFERERQVVVVDALRRQFDLSSPEGPIAEAEAKRRQVTGVAVAASVASVALPLTMVTTAAPTMGGGAAIAGAGVVAAPLFLALVAALPVSIAVDLASGAGYSYPAALMLILPATSFPDEASRDAYFDSIDRSLDVAREALRLHTDEACAFWDCASRSEQDDALIAARRRRLAESRARTQIDVRVAGDLAGAGTDR